MANNLQIQGSPISKYTWDSGNSTGTFDKSGYDNILNQREATNNRYNNYYGKVNQYGNVDDPNRFRPNISATYDWNKANPFELTQQPNTASLQPHTASERSYQRLADETVGSPVISPLRGYTGSGKYKGYGTDGMYEDGTLITERLANLAPEIATLAEVGYDKYKIDEQNDMIQNAKLNSLRAPVTSVAAASDWSPEVMASQREDIGRIRGQYQGADPTMRLVSNQMAQQQRGDALNKMNAQRAQFINQEKQRVQQGLARNQAAEVDTFNKNQLRAQQLEDNKLSARVAHSERERELFTKGLGTMNKHLENRLAGKRIHDAKTYDRGLSAQNYIVNTLAQQSKANPYDFRLKEQLADAQGNLSNMMQESIPKYREFKF